MSGRGRALLRATALVLAVVCLAPVSPLVLVAVPLAVFLLAFAGRSYAGLFLAALLLAAVFAGAGEASSPVWFAERAWGLFLGGGFVLLTIAAPRAPVLARSIGALGAALACTLAFAAARPGAVAEVDWWVGVELDRAALALYQWVGTDVLPGMDEAFRAALGIQATLYPAFLGLASLAALGVAWYVAHRLAGRAEALAPLREFRFSDQLIWVLIGGLALFLLPLGEVLTRLGENAMAFMGALYVLRGLAVLLWLFAAAVSSAWGAVLWGAAALLFYPVVAGAALLIGVGDTWLDLRRRLARAPAGDE